MSKRAAASNETGPEQKKRKTTHAFLRESPGGRTTVMRGFTSPSGRQGFEVKTTTPGGEHSVFHEEDDPNASPSTVAKAQRFNVQRDRNARKKSRKKDGNAAAAAPVTETAPVSREESRKQNHAAREKRRRGNLTDKGRAREAEQRKERRLKDSRGVSKEGGPHVGYQAGESYLARAHCTHTCTRGRPPRTTLPAGHKQSARPRLLPVSLSVRLPGPEVLYANPDESGRRQGRVANL